ncbi:MAG: class I SAM-dependent methyltransferase [Planctomycetaceae bacterium]|jgi:2-polyprenyl-6-hydroxyphenyl methylase/3-demethylubiquinone-9 3-methyltransferase|nr:class I SAM-dependent methyltransferase [Planctomycetaceae bacterium]
MTKNTDAANHFQFGKNWEDYAKLITDERIELAQKELLRLIPEEQLRGGTFLDIGCGSGLHAVAASKCGARDVCASDIDSDSIAAAKHLLVKYCPNSSWKVECISVFDMDAGKYHTFDIVYSWGVLHHTGSMYEAFFKAAEMVKSGGLLVIAVYRKTVFCNFWKAEKFLYKKSPSFVQTIIRGFYKLFLLGYLTIRGNNPFKYLKEYQKNKGISFHHDVHDWLGGYPYESAKPDEVRKFFTDNGFTLEREFVSKQTFGIFGSGCDEFVFRKKY